MAKKAAARKTAAKKAPPRKTAKKKAARPTESKLTYERTRAGNQRPTRVPSTRKKLKRGNRTIDAEVIRAGDKTKSPGARLTRTQKVRDLAGGKGTKFFDRNGKRVSAAQASTQKGNLRAGFQAQRTVNGRNLVLVGGGQAG